MAAFFASLLNCWQFFNCLGGGLGLLGGECPVLLFFRQRLYQPQSNHE